jgi:ABC-type phosphate transport system substrate-binding protein
MLTSKPFLTPSLRQALSAMGLTLLGLLAVVQFVSTTPDAIGYVQAAKVTNKVKVIRK